MESNEKQKIGKKSRAAGLRFENKVREYMGTLHLVEDKFVDEVKSAVSTGVDGE